MAENVNIDSLRTVYLYDPAASGTDFSALRVITGATSISSNQLRLTSSTVQTRDAFIGGRLTMNMKIQTAPAGGHARIWGFYSSGLPTLGSAYFEITGTTFRSVSYDNNGTAETTTLTWSASYTNTSTEFRIDWLEDRINFYISDVKVASHTTRLGTLPMPITIKNGVADNWDTAFLVMTDINKTTTGSSGGDLAEFPTPALLTDNFATPTTTAVGSFNMVYDGATWDFMRGDAAGGVFEQGAIANDAVDSGNPVKIGGVAVDPTSLPTAVSVGDRVNASFSQQGEALVYVSRLGSAEDQANTLLQVIQKPLVGSIYAPSAFQNLGANATLNVKASAGNVFSLTCHNINAATRFIQLHNLASVPTGGEVPLFTSPIAANGLVIIGTDFFTTAGKYFSTGISFAFSTTEGTYTAGVATDQFTHINYI